MRPGDVFERIDARLGAGIERAVEAHHRRRLGRIGQGSRLDPPPSASLWAAGDPPVRAGCDLEVLIDGAEALPRIAAAIAGARRSVHIAGWHITPGFGLTRDGSAQALRDLLAQTAERVPVRVLLWAGAPLPVFTPSRAAVRAVRDDLLRDSRVRCALDASERPMHCHHEKLVIVDGEVAFVGGIDLTSLGGDRFDSSEHAVLGRQGWHDVATCVRGPAVADVAAHFAMRWAAADGEVLPPAPVPAPAGDLQLQLVRTVPEKVYDALPDGDFRILEAYLRALRSARRLVYLESQFLWSPAVVSVLRDKLADPPGDDFRIVTLLPSHPNNGTDDTRGQIGALLDADDGAGRFLAATIAARSGRLSGPLYVHAKVGIVDDVWLTIGSANLNEHSFFNDTEVNIVACDPGLARRTRLRLWAEHLERPVQEVAGDPTDVVDHLWRPIAAGQLARIRDRRPRTHRLSSLPGLSRRSAALLGPLDSLVVDG
jgi:phosphatidylserine/phosphatidylglycerophosphate/cardiolipin synthase-like enzyme